MDENTEENTEKNAWRFVDLVFTGKYHTDQQYDNLVKLVKFLIDNYETALPYIDLDIKSLIYDAFNGSNSDLKKRLNTCYESLYFKRNEDDLPYYLIELKKLISADENDADKKDTDIKDADKKDTNIKFTDEDRELIKKLYEQVGYLFKKYYTYINRNSSTRQIDDLDLRIKNASKETEIKIKKEIYPQFITILGIFTAITFAIFGGMNLLSNLFKNMRNTHASLGQALILASIFGFTLWGLIEILFLWISKINLIKDDKKEDCSGSERPCTNDKCLNKNCSNIECSNEICLNKDCSNAIDKEEIKIVKHKKIFYWFALSFLTVILIMGFMLFFF